MRHRRGRVLTFAFVVWGWNEHKPFCQSRLLDNKKNGDWSRGEYDVVLGNPPWERIKLQEQEFFAAKDLENCLEDAVSIFEATNKALVVRKLKDQDVKPEDISNIIRKIGTSFQNIKRTEKAYQKHFSLEIGSLETMSRLELAFAKRHPITHNLGVVDLKYLEQGALAQEEGREIYITKEEVKQVLEDVESTLAHIHSELSSE